MDAHIPYSKPNVHFLSLQVTVVISVFELVWTDTILRILALSSTGTSYIVRGRPARLKWINPKTIDHTHCPPSAVVEAPSANHDILNQ